MQRIRKIVIVGGGTAGWLSAAYLNRAFGANMEIVVVESERIGRIGVGEATVPTLRDTLAFIGMDEDEWMPRCNATFKSAVKFVGWRKPSVTGQEHVYYHPFFAHPEPLVNPLGRPFFMKSGQGFSLVHPWLKRWLGGQRETFGAVCNPLQRLCELNKSPRPLPGSGVADPRFRYAYQLDAALIAEYLRELATGRGVRHVRLDVVGGTLDERGHIDRLHTEQGVDVEGDLFLDCTGFRGLLINEIVGEPFIRQNNFLLCDSAVAMPARNDPERDDLRPYTTANAMPNGWIWEIPLYHRDGTGYVYSSQTTDGAAAEQSLRAFLGPRCDDAASANHIKMRVGYNRRSWVGNCVAVGLSSCFVEPLESTTIFLIEFELAHILLHFPDLGFDPQFLDRYNSAIQEAFEDMRDFIVMHYCLTNRDDSEFWRRVRHELPIPDSLQVKLARFASGEIMPEGAHLRLFEARSFACILSGMDFPFRRSAPLLDYFDDRQADEVFREIRAQTREVSASFPSHYAYLKAQHARVAAR